ECLAEAQEAAFDFGYFDRYHRLALAADVGALGHVAQAVEIHIGAAVDRDERAFAALLALYVTFDAGDGQRTRRLDDGAILFEDVLHGRADLVGADQDDLVDVLAHQAECFFADAPHGDAIRE